MGSAVSCSAASVVGEYCYTSSPSGEVSTNGDSVDACFEQQQTKNCCPPQGTASALHGSSVEQHLHQTGSFREPSSPQINPHVCSALQMEAALSGSGALMNGLWSKDQCCRSVGETTAADHHHANELGGRMVAQAVTRLQGLKQQLESGGVPGEAELLLTLNIALEALAARDREHRSEEGQLESIRDQQVREWLSTTFTRSDSIYEARSPSKPTIAKFRAAANTIIISHYLGSIHRDMSVDFQFSEAVAKHLEKADHWDYDVFELDALSERRPLRSMAHYLLKKHDLFEKCQASSCPLTCTQTVPCAPAQISPTKFDCFMMKIEEAYLHYGNPYHTACHGADVAQTLNCILETTGLVSLLTDVELLALLLAALIHDVDHPGTTNSFQVNTRSRYALIYNDRSVLENHHLYFSFALLQEPSCCFLTFTAEEFKLIRALIIEMVISTDMSSHFDQTKHMKHVMSSVDAVSQLESTERGRMFGLLLHAADVSHPTKPWQLHRDWTMRLAEEFYRQGDEEKRRGIAISPLCNRKDSDNLPTSQIGFIDVIVAPSFQLCGEMLMAVVSKSVDSTGEDGEGPQNTVSSPSAGVAMQVRTWEHYLADNKLHWEAEKTKRVVKVDGCGDAVGNGGLSTNGVKGSPSTSSSAKRKLEKQVKVSSEDELPQ